MNPIRNIVVIEKPVKEEIQISEKNLFCEPVETLDELVELENHLQFKGIDYAIAEFDYRAEQDDNHRHTWKRLYSIFVIMKYGRIEAVPREFKRSSSYFLPIDDDTQLLTHILHSINLEKKTIKSDSSDDL